MTVICALQGTTTIYFITSCIVKNNRTATYNANICFWINSKKWMLYWIINRALIGLSRHQNTVAVCMCSEQWSLHVSLLFFLTDSYGHHWYLTIQYSIKITMISSWNRIHHLFSFEWPSHTNNIQYKRDLHNSSSLGPHSYCFLSKKHMERFSVIFVICRLYSLTVSLI